MNKITSSRSPITKHKLFAALSLTLVISLGLFFIENPSAIAQTANSSSCPNIAAPKLTDRIDTTQLQSDIKDLKSQSNTLKDAANKHVQGNTADTEKTIEDVSHKRAPLLVTVMRNNPDAALQNVLPNDERTEVSKVKNGCAEQTSTVEGIVNILHADFAVDNFGKTTSTTVMTLTTDNGQKITLHPANEGIKPLESSMRIKVTGDRIGDDLLFNAGDAKQLEIKGTNILPTAPKKTSFLNNIMQYFVHDAVAQAVPDSVGPQKTIIILGNLSDTPQPNLTAAQVQDMAGTQMNNFWQENSYGKASVTSTVVGWYQLNVSLASLQANGCSTQPAFDAAKAAADPDVDFSQYSHVIYIIPGLSSCFIDGISSIGKVATQTQDGTFLMSFGAISADVLANPNRGQFALTHEFGHGLGLHHSHGLSNCTSNTTLSSCSVVEYGDPFSVMGGTETGSNSVVSIIGHIPTGEKEYLGWLGGTGVKTVTTDGSYTIEPTETNTTGVKELKLPRPNGDFLTIEYRQPIGADQALANIPNSNAYNGAMLNIHLDPSTLIDANANPINTGTATAILESGQAWKDPDTGTAITVTNVTPAGLTVQINGATTNGVFSADTKPPVANVTSPTNNQVISSNPVTFTTNVTDNRGIQKVEFYDEFYGKDSPMNVDFSAPFSYTRNLDAGQHKVFVKAYDLSNNIQTSPTITFTVPAAIGVDSVAPTAQMTQPGNNSQVSGTVIVSANATDAVGVSRVEFYADNKLIQTVTTSPYSVEWNTIAYPSGSTHILFVQAYDAAGNSAISNIINVTVK